MFGTTYGIDNGRRLAAAGDWQRANGESAKYRKREGRPLFDPGSPITMPPFVFSPFHTFAFTSASFFGHSEDGRAVLTCPCNPPLD
jgi:hypothetical protein